MAAVLPELEDLGAEVYGANSQYHLIEAGIDVSALSEVASLPGVLSLTSVYRPSARTGGVDTQGDEVLNADVVRSLGYDGSPLLVGVLSDSALDIHLSQDTDDLPPTVARYLEFAASDEGRAMLEIVHDVAPGAALAHHSGIWSELSFADGIRALSEAGSRVIVDDLMYFTEPFFQDGIIAQAVDDVAAQYDVLYVSAAGNDADRSYEALFADNGTQLHDFDPDVGADTRQQITIPAGWDVPLILQWDDPFYTTDGVTHNFDVRVYDDSGELVAESNTDNVATQQPLEIVRIEATGSGIYEVEIERIAGSGDSYIKYILATNSDEGSIEEYATFSGTVVGHAAADGAVAVGAVPYFEPTTIEPYSSHGSATIYFDAAGNRLSSPEVRVKPDVVAPDNVNTTFFGRDITEDDDTFPNFAGTSAAAPHVAGVAALLLDANPNLTRDELYQVLTTTATDLGDVGYDTIFGYGLVNAEAAFAAAVAVSDATSPTAVIVSPAGQTGWHVESITVDFSEPMAAAAATPANYTLLGTGDDGEFDTGDDVVYSLVATYDDASHRTILAPSSPHVALPDGGYRLTLHGAELVDPSGNPLGGGANQDHLFSVGFVGDITPVEGAARTDLRPDGTAVMVYPHNPFLGRYKWPQVMVGQYDPNGVSTGPYLCVPTDIRSSFRVTNPDVAVNASSGVVVYSDYDEIVRGEPDSYPVGYQLLDADGRPVGDRRSVGWSWGKKNPRVAMNSAGSFAITYDTYGWYGWDDGYYVYVKGRLFNAAGDPVGSAFTVNQLDGASKPVVGVATDGTVVFAWTLGNADGDGSGKAVVARRFDAAGSPLGNEFVVNQYTSGDQKDPDIVVAGDGSFAVVWSGAGDGGNGVFLRRYDADGNPLSPQVRLATGSGGAPQVAMANDGRLVAVWLSPDGDGQGVFVQRVAADGTNHGDTIWISRGAEGSQETPRVAMAEDGDFLVTWGQADGPKSRWVSWEGTGEDLPFGPWIRDAEPSSPALGSLSEVMVTFNRAVDATTFDLGDVSVWDPVGRVIEATSVTTTDDRTFTIGFSPQDLPGTYRILVGPDIADAAGQLMNQDGDSVNGEASDRYSGSFAVAPTAATVPANQDFEAGSIDSLAHSCSFATTGDGVVSVSPETPALSGSYSLRMDQAHDDYGSETAVLTVDLAGATGVTLDFWGRELTDPDGIASLSLSEDGVNWVLVEHLYPLVGTWRHWMYDLDAAVATAGLSYDSDFHVRFYHEATYYSRPSAFVLDDIRVATGIDVFGASIVAQVPSESVDGPIASIDVTFDEEMDASSFTAADVTVTGPVGNAVALDAATPISDSGDHRTFTIHLASPQALAGRYTVQVGPDVLDVAGNMMNQNGDALPGDEYAGTFDVNAQHPS